MTTSTAQQVRHINSRGVPSPPFMIGFAMLAMLFAAVPSFSQSFPVIKTINVDIQPFGATITPDGTQVWVANSGKVTNNSNKVTIIDVATLKEEANKITVGQFPEDIVFTKDSQVAYVTNSSDATVSVIDTATRTVKQTVSLAPLGITFPFGIVLSQNENKAFITDGGGVNQGVAVLNTANRNNVKAATTIPVLGFPGRPALRPVGNELLVATNDPQTNAPELVLINPQTNQISHELLLPGHATAGPQDIAVTDDSRFAYISLFDFSANAGGVWVVDLLHFSTVTVIPTGDPEVFGLGITPDGRFVLATNFKLNQMVAISTSTNTVVASTPVGRNPNEIAITLDGSEAFVTNQGDTTVSVISIPPM